MIKGYQLELNFKQEQEQLNSENAEPTTVEESPTTHRGSKSFIEQMNSIEEQQMFDNKIEEGKQ